MTSALSSSLGSIVRRKERRPPVRRLGLAASGRELRSRRATRERLPDLDQARYAVRAAGSSCARRAAAGRP